MDRLDFTSRMQYNLQENMSKEKEICKHFDEIMGLYDVIGIMESSILAHVNENNIQFNILTNNQDEANYIMAKVYNTTINKYGKIYKIEPVVFDNMISITLTNGVSG